MPRRTPAGPAAITALVLLLAALLLLVLPPRASGEVRTIVSFDATAGQNPEGLAVDGDGTVFVSFAALGQLARVEPGASNATPFGNPIASVPSTRSDSPVRWSKRQTPRAAVARTAP